MGSCYTTSHTDTTAKTADNLPVRAIIYFDGLCEPINPGGHCCFGYVIDLDNGRTITGKGSVGIGTNNKAEYCALIEALKAAKKAAVKEVDAYGDSMLVVRQVSGEWAVKSESIEPLFRQAVRLSQSFPLFHIEWIPREQNERADLLSRQAYNDLAEGPAVRMRDRARAITKDGLVQCLQDGKYLVNDYNVDIETLTCTCKYWKTHHGEICKHIIAAQLSAKGEVSVVDPF